MRMPPPPKKKTTHLLLRPRVKEPGQDVPGVAEHQLHVHVARLLGDRVHVLAARRGQVAADLAELNARVFFFQFGKCAVEHRVAERDEHDAEALGGELVGQGLADAYVFLLVVLVYWWWWWCFGGVFVGFGRERKRERKEKKNDGRRNETTRRNEDETTHRCSRR
jgi:hypothetical protein